MRQRVSLALFRQLEKIQAASVRLSNPQGLTQTSKRKQADKCRVYRENELVATMEETGETDGYWGSQ
jgi:hypothetical protein